MRTVFLSAFLHECRPLVAPHAAHFRCQTEHVFSRSACPHMKTAPGEAVLLEHEKLGVPAARGRTHVTSFGGVGTSALMLALSAAGAAINSGGEHDKAIARRAVIFNVDENLFEEGAQGATDAVGLEIWRAEQQNATPLD